VMCHTYESVISRVFFWKPEKDSGEGLGG